MKELIIVLTENQRELYEKNDQPAGTKFKFVSYKQTTLVRNQLSVIRGAVGKGSKKWVKHLS